MTRDNRILLLTLLLWGVGESMWYHIRSLYFEQLGASPAEVGLALGIGALTVAAAFLVGGVLADRFDRKSVLLLGWVLGLAGPLPMALAADWRQAMVGFMIFNASFLVVPVLDTYVSHAAGGAPLERVYPLVYSGFWIGSIFGPQASRLLLGVIDLRGVVAASTVMYVLSTLALLAIGRQPVTRLARRPDGAADPLAALRSLRWFFVFLFFIVFAMSVGAQFVPNYLEGLGWPMAEVSGLISAQTIGTAVLSVLAGHLAAGRRWRGLLLAQLLGLASMISLAFGAHVWGGFAAAGLFMMGGQVVARQQASAQVVQLTHEANRGMALAVSSTIAELALVAAPIAAGVLFGVNAALPFYAGLALIPVGLVWTMRLRARRPMVPRRAAPMVDGASYSLSGDQ